MFFFQAEDGIRDTSVTGVQTCALPILTMSPAQTPPSVRASAMTAVRNANCVPACAGSHERMSSATNGAVPSPPQNGSNVAAEIGRASWRERGWLYTVLITSELTWNNSQ